ncbi:MAG TPA: Type 1 glutamine amidotransferase-like domain-containing protein [Candidatus Limnocylindrales bacterium]|nr:Type 1 glutamine amidotransferase-like domain-containing protein [Candidatus Limnocylindrales bacterium]
MPIALHGGGEFLPGDEPFLDAVVRAVGTARSGDRPLHVVLVPTAAARGRPDLAAAHGVEAFRARGAAAGLTVDADVARIVDVETANDERLAALLANADVVYFPGGDPDLIPTLLAGTAAERALRAALERGAVVGGASAGAMAMAEWTWTAAGGIPGLGFVPGVAVFPHYDERRRREWQANLERIAPAGLGYLGLDERTGMISEGDEWVVAGEGAAYWFAPGAEDPLVVAAGGRLRL